MALDSFFFRHSAWLGEDSGRRLLTAALVALTLASALAWGWAVWRSSLPVPDVAAAAPPAPLPTQLSAADLARLLGEAGPAASPPAQRFVVLGVIARPSGQGAALIAVDGAPARPFSVGAEVAPGLVIQRLAAREVMLAASMAGPVTLVLPLPAWERAPAAAASAATPAAAAAAAGETSSAAPQRRGESGGP